MSAPTWAWLTVSGLVIVFLLTDLRLNRHHDQTMRRAAVFSGAWVAIGILFGGALWVAKGPGVASQYYSAYLLEKSLSVDNIFVFVAVFSSLSVPEEHQRRVLFYGVFGALLLRAAFIASGTALLERFSVAFYAFGVIVLLTGLRMAVKRSGTNVSQNALFRLARNRLPMIDHYERDRFFVRHEGHLVATPLVIVLLAIEATDLIFATDSIPAAFGVTRDVFVIFTANAFAVLGLRALYFVLRSAVDRFEYLRFGISFLLCFIGVKMLASALVSIPTWATLVVIGGSVGTSIALSPRIIHGESSD